MSPFGKFTYSTGNVRKADERDKQKDSAKDSSPENSANEVVDYQVLHLLAPMRSCSGVHHGRLFQVTDGATDGGQGTLKP